MALVVWIVRSFCFHDTSEWAASILLVLKRLQRKVVVRLKAMYSFFQIVVNLGFNCTVRFPASFEVVVAKLKIVNLDVVGSLGLSCITKVDYIDEMMFTTLVPIVIAVLASPRGSEGSACQAAAAMATTLKTTTTTTTTMATMATTATMATSLAVVVARSGPRREARGAFPGGRAARFP